MPPIKTRLLGFAACLTLLPLMACDNSGSGPAAIPLAAAPVWTEGEFAHRERYANFCANPREGINPSTGQPYLDRPGTAMHEKMWLRSLVDELYLWQDEVADVNPALSQSLDEYFKELKVESQDPFSFYDDADRAHARNQGMAVDYGIQWDLSETTAGNLVVRVSDVAAASPYFGVVQRGDILREVDGMAALGPVTHDSYALIMQALYPRDRGEVHAVKLRKLVSDELLELTLEAVQVTYDTVPRYTTVESNGEQIGYLQFNDHLAKSEAELVSAIGSLAEAGIEDLVLDLRYNPGGYIDIASELAYMIAGPGHTRGEVFYQVLFNERLGGIDPFTQQPTESYPFHETTVFAGAEATSLPTLNLNRVFVLTSPRTCSASEFIINGLEGVGVEVLQFGLPTCGKPYGSVEMENCGKAYNWLMFKGANGQDYGDFTDGFIPSGSAEQLAENILPGCQVPDDLNHQLGDPEEALLAAALYFREHGSCPPAMVQALQAPGQNLESALPLPPVQGRALMRF